MRYFIDRTYALLNPDFTPRLDAGKKDVIIGAQGAHEAEAFTSVYDEFEKRFKMLGMDVKNTFVDVGHHRPGEVKENAELMNQAKAAGTQLFD